MLSLLVICKALNLSSFLFLLKILRRNQNEFWFIGCVHRGSPLFVFLIKYDCANSLCYFSRAESFDIIHRKQIHEHGSGYSVRAFTLDVSPD